MVFLISFETFHANMGREEEETGQDFRSDGMEILDLHDRRSLISITSSSTQA